MFTVICKNTKTGTEERYEFETAKLAQIYTDYHLNFGHWQGKAKWIKEAELFPENHRFIIDEMTKEENGVIVRYYYITDGLVIDTVIGEVTDSFSNLRSKRNRYLRESDWTQLADAAVTAEERKQYRDYRQYLRDVPKLYNGDTVHRSIVKTFSEWLEFRKNGVY